MFLSLLRSFTVLAWLVALGVASTAVAQDGLDRALREGRQAGRSQRVILKAKPGYEAWARQLLERKGKAIDGALPSINAITAELSALELDAICSSTVFAGCSADTTVWPTAARGKKVWASNFSYHIPR